jgi:hypothetical protein
MSMNDSHTLVILKGVSIAGKWHVGCGDIDFMFLRESADRALQVYERGQAVSSKTCGVVSFCEINRRC